MLLARSVFLTKCRVCSLLQQNVRCLAAKKNFFQDFIDKVRDEYQKDKSVQDQLQKFRAEKDKLEKSDELQKVRDYYKNVETELRSNTEKLRDSFDTVKDKVDDLKKMESLKKSIEGLSNIGQGVSKTAQKAAEQLAQSDILKKTQDIVESELVRGDSKMYKPPSVLKTRKDLAGKTEEKVYSPDDTSTGMVLHKDSKWFAAWTSFKDNNQYVQKFFDLKSRYDESENIAVRSTKFITDRVSSLFGGMFTNTETQEVLTEIHNLDPSFSVEDFLKFCRLEIIPNILEAMNVGNLKILEDWCHEAPYNLLATPIKQVKQLGYKQDNKVLDVHHVDLTTGKMMDQGPVLIISFVAQQIMAVRDPTNKVIEGNPEKILRVTHVWALCRDKNELNPWAAWRILDLAMMPSDQWL